ncbi:MipA/OmpV family protein [Cupriavidus sp. 2KB_3]|uniref:MipA/OmpV family protein n=1 Tax=Cupriavidus TaxID=106589 RepID=UPI0021CCBA73|nr:MipA/OmpV family protein [Cupriavidus campinensis]
MSARPPYRRKPAPSRFLGVLLAGAASTAMASPFDLPSTIPNMFGLGVGSTTQYAGGNERMIGVLPGLRYTSESGRLLEWYGPYAQFNFGSLTGFQYGPAVSLRLGRNNVDDAVVARIHEIDTTVEAGGFISYEYIHSGGIPYRLRGGINVLTNAGIVYGGARVSATGTFWVPVHTRMMLGLGMGLTWVSGSFNRTYFGVTAEDSAASGLPVYTPGGGLQQGTGWLGAIYRIDKHWHAGAMVYYQRIAGSAADSPIVTQRGTRNQVTYGAGIAYAWR